MIKTEKRTRKAYKERELNLRELEFCRLYAEHGNASAAYREAYGYDKYAAGPAAHTKLKKRNIQEEIARIRAETQQKQGISRDWIEGQLIMQIEAAKSEERPDRVTITRCLETLCRMNGLFTDNINMTDAKAKQRELDEKEESEAREIARIRLAKVG